MKDKIAKLRASAQSIRQSAQYADRNSDYQAEMRLAAERDNEANELEAQLNAELNTQAQS